VNFSLGPAFPHPGFERLNRYSREALYTCYFHVVGMVVVCFSTLFSHDSQYCAPILKIRKFQEAKLSFS